MDWSRIGLAFWVRRPRYWTPERLARVVQGEELFATPPPGTWLEQPSSADQRFRTHQPSLGNCGS